MAEYLIHACPVREWYVEDYLIPSMVEQGISRNHIEVWMDRQQDGCLFSCMKCFAEYGKRGGGRWHLQDDVVISKRFRELTEAHDEGVVAGFFREDWQSGTPQAGNVPAVYLWNSFQCIRIPDEVIRECAEWFFMDALYQDIYREAVETNKMDDSLFHDFFTNYRTGDMVLNLKPNIVDHVDYLIGGSVINQSRGKAARADLWEDLGEVEELKAKLARR